MRVHTGPGLLGLVGHGQGLDVIFITTGRVLSKDAMPVTEVSRDSLAAAWKLNCRGQEQTQTIVARSLPGLQ